MLRLNQYLSDLFNKLFVSNHNLSVCDKIPQSQVYADSHIIVDVKGSLQVGVFFYKGV